MAKIQDYSQVHAEIESQLLAQEHSITDLIGHELAVLCILNIYYTNDVCNGFGQDFKNGISIVSSPQRISVIMQGSMSYYKSEISICLYNNLADDVESILIVLQTAIDRLQANF